MTISTRSWTRPEAVSCNRLPMTTFLRGPEEIVSLDGDWSFALLDRPGGAVRCEATLAVPGCWTMQGVGDPPQYTNIQMPFPGPPPLVPDTNPTGVYRRRIEVPAAWNGRRIVLHVAGAESVLYVEVDGEAVGMGTDSRLPQEFDLTGLVRAGSSFELVLTVVRWSAATYLEDQDHWHHAGLHRSVLLYTTPVTYIGDVRSCADWDPATGAGHLSVEASFSGPQVEGARLRFLLDGSQVGEAPARWEHPTDTLVNAYLFEGHQARVAANVPDAAPWSAEHPRLHDLTVELTDESDVLDTVTFRVGFRRVEVRGHELLVNGRPVLIKGVNRHDHDPRAGKAVTRASIRRDIELMKAHNLNAVRTSHYPNDAYLYEVCDELGMYVVDEANLETHAHLRWLTKAPEWAPAILERITRIARRDKNHPSVIVWSLGNESGSSPVLDAAATWLRSYDPTRPVQYESGAFEAQLHGRTAVEVWRMARRDTDIVAPMYPSIEDLEAWATTEAPSLPLIMCEYLHAMNNSCGDLDRYWAAIRAHPGLQGGFIWDWVDQALVRDAADGREVLAYGGDFGDEPNDGTFCLNGLVAADRTPHPSLLEAKVVLQPVRFAFPGDGAVELTNEHDFTDLADVADVDWAVTVDGDEVAGGTFGRVRVAPGASTVIRVPLPPLELSGWQVAHLTVRVGEVAVGQTELARSQQHTPLPGSVELPMRLSVWRAPVDNEREGPHHRDRWRAVGVPDAHDRLPLRTAGDGGLVTHEVTIPPVWHHSPGVGVLIELPPVVASVPWLGRGPHECYSDRQAGALFGRWHTTVDGWGTPYVHPQANGNRTGVRQLHFLDAQGRLVLRIDEMDDLDVTVSRWTDEELDAAGHREELPPGETAFVWIDARHRGVGSGAVGPDVSVGHRVGPGSYRWSYRLSRP
jgi:beta-galactosidase